VSIGGEHDSRAGEMDGVERVQEFRLGLGLVAQEMDVIDDKEGQATHGPPKLFDSTISNGSDVFVRELFACEISDGIVIAERIAVSSADALKQMRLSKPAASMDEQW